MKHFNNRENKAYNINGKLIWESRSVAVSGTIIIEIENEKYVLSGKRGSNAADNKGYWNLICGYLDWDENLQEAMEREIWEESGLDLNILKKNLILDNLSFPWRVDSNPNSNRQNVTIHFGCLSKQNYFPKLNTENNEVLNETEELKWININEIDKFDWAFNHNKIIKKYIKKYKI